MSACDGGSAFPVLRQHAYDSTVVGSAGGMTLRDWFAGQAPEMPDQWWQDTKAQYGGRVGAYAEAIAAWRYFYADAMLKAREAGQ